MFGQSDHEKLVKVMVKVFDTIIKSARDRSDDFSLGDTRFARAINDALQGISFFFQTNKDARICAYHALKTKSAFFAIVATNDGSFIMKKREGEMKPVISHKVLPAKIHWKVGSKCLYSFVLLEDTLKTRLELMLNEITTEFPEYEDVKEFCENNCASDAYTLSLKELFRQSNVRFISIEDITEHPIDLDLDDKEVHDYRTDGLLDRYSARCNIFANNGKLRQPVGEFAENLVFSLGEFCRRRREDNLRVSRIKPRLSIEETLQKQLDKLRRDRTPSVKQDRNYNVEFSEEHDYQEPSNSDNERYRLAREEAEERARQNGLAYYEGKYADYEEEERAAEARAAEERARDEAHAKEKSMREFYAAEHKRQQVEAHTRDEVRASAPSTAYDHMLEKHGRTEEQVNVNASQLARLSGLKKNGATGQAAAGAESSGNQQAAVNVDISKNPALKSLAERTGISLEKLRESMDFLQRKTGAVQTEVMSNEDERMKLKEEHHVVYPEAI